MIFVYVKRTGHPWQRERIFVNVAELRKFVMTLYGQPGVEGVDITNADGSEFRYTEPEGS
jgi:hypothetical protein